MALDKDFRVKNGLTVNSTLTVSSNVNSISTTSGAAIITGGLGVGRNLYVGGNINVAGTINASVSGIATTATNIAGGSQGQIHYQSAPGVTAFVNSGTTGQFLQATTNGAPVFTNTGSMYVGSAANAEKLITARTITLAGDLSGNVSFDGSTNVTLTATVTTDAVALGTDTTGIYVAQGATSGFGISGTANTEGSTFTVTSNATSSNTVNTIVYRDASGNFSAANVTLAGTTAASSTNSGALQVAGGVGIGGALYIGTSSYIFGAQILTSATVNQFVTAGVSSVSAGTDTAVSQTTGAVVIWNTATLQSVTTRGATTTNIISITNTTSSISTTTGAMIIAGGLGVGRTITALEHHTPTGLANRPSSNYDITGNLGHFHSAANIGRSSGGDLNFGDGNTPSVIRGFPGLGFIRAYINNDPTNNQLWFGNSTGLVVGNGTSPAAKLDVVGSARISGVTSVTNSTISTSTQSGALQVAGGVGIGGKLFVGGLTNSTSTSVLYYNTSTGEFTYGTSFASGGGGTTSPFSGIFTITNTTAATSTSSGALQVSGGVGVGGSLYATNVFAGGAQITGFNSQEFTASAGQTVFTVTNGYIVGQVEVFANGISLNASDYTASNGSSITLTESRRLNDVIKIISGKNIGVSSQQAYIFTEVVASTAGQTTFTANYNFATVQVFVDGVLRSPSAYTASNGTSIVLSSGSGIVNGTRIGVLSFNSVSITGAVSLSGGTVNGTLNVNGSLQQNGTDLKSYTLAMSVAMGI